MNKENSNTSKPNKLVLCLLQRLDLRSPNKHVTSYMWKKYKTTVQKQ